MKVAQMGGIAASLTRQGAPAVGRTVPLHDGLPALGTLISRSDKSGLMDVEWESAGAVAIQPPRFTSYGDKGMDIAPTLSDMLPLSDALPRIQALTARPGWKAIFKRATDIVGGLVLIFCACPLMLMIAAAIKCTSRGPIIFRQERMGLHGKVFVVFKFRTMYTHLGDPLAAQQTTARDGRVTPLGRVLRRTSLDELPQFFNVVLGDMSLVGPRPHALGTSVKGVPLDIADVRYPLRHLVRPGITGWAQINGSRGALLSAEHLRRRIDHDLHYVIRTGPLFDLRIMCRTLVQLLTAFDAC